MPRHLAIDASVYRQPASGVQLAVHHAVLAELEACRGIFDTLLLGSLPGAQPSVQYALPGWAQSVAGRIFWQQFHLPGLLQKAGVELLHAQAYTMPLRGKIPVLLNVHDIIALEYPQYCSWRNVCHMRALLPGSLRRAKLCLVSTRHVAQRLRQLLQVPYDKIEVLPWGVDFQRFSQPGTLGSLQLPERYFLFVGNLEPKKNLELLLQAYALVAEKSACSLLIVGRAAWKSRRLLQKIRDWPGPGRILWLGRLDDALLPGVYQRALAFIMPSLEEGFGLPVLEAMAAGSAVIHSDQAALCEVAANKALCFNARKADELAKQMLRVSQDSSLRKELEEQGREHARQQTWQKWGEGAVQILKNM